MDRVPCLVPFCRCSTRENQKEWICQKHWSQVPRHTRSAFNLTKKRIRRVIRFKPEYCAYWHMKPGSPARLAACRMWNRYDQAWAKCKKQAIEKAVGI